jgi:hypothetical protein
LKADNSFSVPKSSTKPTKVMPAVKQVEFKRLETEILETDIIESSLLMINNKDMMVTTDRLNIHTVDNSIQVPSNGPIKINNTLQVDKDTVRIHGNLELDQELQFGVRTRKVRRITLEPELRIEKLDYKQTNIFIFDCIDINSKSNITLAPYDMTEHVVSLNKIEYLYSIQFMVNAGKDTLVDIDIHIPEQEVVIKLHSRFSSVSLLWVPEGRWLVESIGFKTTVLDK